VIRAAMAGLSKLADAPGLIRGFSARSAPAVFPMILLHGGSDSGVARYDELILFGGIGLVLAVLVFLSWRAGRQGNNKKRRRRRRR
jgi:hypothetical protein